ncbi:MAG: O-antigen ligase family protein [Candidatus Geothermincolia bacterium]
MDAARMTGARFDRRLVSPPWVIFGAFGLSVMLLAFLWSRGATLPALLIVALPLLVLAEHRLQFASIMLPLLLYVGLAMQSFRLISVGGRTLYLSPGDLGLVVVAGMLMLFAAGRTVSGESAFDLPWEGKRVLLPLGILAVLFLSSTFLAALGPLSDRVRLTSGLLFYFRWIAGPAFFVLALNTRLKPGGFRRVLVLLSTVLAIGFVFALFSNTPEMRAFTKGGFSEYTRLSGVFPDPNEMGQLAVLLLAGLLGFQLVAERSERRLLPWLCIGGLGVMIFLSQSRESLVTLMVAIAVMIALLLRNRRRLGALLLVAVVIAGVVVLMQLPRVANTFAELKGGEMGTALNGRDAIWGISLDLISRYPVTGIGFESLSSITGKQLYQAHNGFLQAALVSGMLGLLAYLWLLIATGRRLLAGAQHQSRAVKAVFIGLASVFTGYVVTALVSDHFITFYSYNCVFWALAGMAMGVLAASRAGEERRDADTART